MPSEDEAVPTTQEVERQLERMLANPVFTEAETQAKLLDYLVKAAFAGKVVTEKTIIADLFPFYLRDPSRTGPEPSSIVRVFKNKLLERLDEYYERHGAGDLVLIALLSTRKKGYKPRLGQAYRPIFRYNPDSPIDQDYRRGLYHLDQCTPADDSIALDYFEAVLKQKSEHAYAQARKAEVHLRRAMYYHVDLTAPQSLKLAAAALTAALRTNDGVWRAHAIQGALHCFHRRWEKARASFERALELDAFQTRYGAWYYPGFLMATGRSEEALALIGERARLCPDDLLSQVAHGIFLYLTRRFDEALLALTLAESMNARHWLTHTVWALLALSRNEPPGAHVILVHHLVGDDIFPGLLALCLASELRLRDNPEQWGPGRRNATDPLFGQVYAALDELIDKLPKPPQQLGQLIKMSQEKYIPPLQLALAHMAVNDSRRAIQNLKHACDEPCPLIAWLHLLPLFDPIHDDAAFQKLLRRTNLPLTSPTSAPSV
jgi:tetratricopeptide (TPR) repeat protein